MELDDALYKAFLVELEALEKFRMGYSARHPAAPLGREDQDVRRLVEAMALFNARTRLAGQRALQRSTLRMFRQHFPFVLSPMPAMAMLEARPELRFVDAAELPRGTQVVLSRPRDTASAPAVVRPGAVPERVTFRTVAPLRLLPIALERVDTVRLGGRGTRLLLTFESAFSRNDALETLRLHVHHLDELLSSLALFHALKTHLRAASVFFDREPKEDEAGLPVRMRFGAPPPDPAELESFEHPLQRVRSLLHFPQQDLFVEAHLPPTPRNWRRVTLCLDLGHRWPAQLRVTPEALRLHVVPMVNLTRQFAHPIECDGTKERHPLVHPDAALGHRLHSIAGVYRLDGEGLVPLRPAIVEGGDGTWELDQTGQGADRRSALLLELRNAFAQPVRVAADAWWHQPTAQPLDATGLRASLHDRFLEGVRWELQGAIAPARENRLERSPDGLLQLLSIKNQRLLGHADLVFLLEALGARDLPAFADLVDALGSVEVRPLPFVRKTTGFKYVYRIVFTELEPFLLPALDLFGARLLELLQAWSVEDVVELELAVPNLEHAARYPQEEAEP